MPKTSKELLRKKAYEYIRSQISYASGTPRAYVPPAIMPLDDLMSLKNGQADPTETLVSLLKQTLRGSVSEAEIDAQLVTPFKHRII
jgi:hypothetical protein